MEVADIVVPRDGKCHCKDDEEMVLASPPQTRDVESLRHTRDSSVEMGEDTTASATAELSSIVSQSIIANSLLNTSSNPVSPGPASPPLEQAKGPDIVPPTRPSSTPFPNAEPRESLCCLPGPGDDNMAMFQPSEESPLALVEPQNQPVSTSLCDLPAEIHEAILDHLFGFRVSAHSKSSVDMVSVTTSWSTIWRYARRTTVSRLALVNRVWRDLVQARLYRHIKIKGIDEDLAKATEHLSLNPRLAGHVRHLEVWFPVFQSQQGNPNLSNTLPLPTVTNEGLITTTYILPRTNASLREVFEFISWFMPGIRVLTLEGGDRKRAPKVRTVPEAVQDSPTLPPKLSSVETLVTKGQWNLIRDEEDFKYITSTLPNVREWHGTYSKPKSKSYLTMARFLPMLPSTITRLNLCLEGDYKRELTIPHHYLKVSRHIHFCKKLALATPALEELTYTGRVCHVFFDMVALKADARFTRLRKIDLTLKNTCRPLLEFDESGNGIQDKKFIQSFESLVLSAVRSLEKLTAIRYLRIRYVDLGKFSRLHQTVPAGAIRPSLTQFICPRFYIYLESICLPLNPWFIYRNGVCSGVWSERILERLQQAAPDAVYERLSTNFCDIGWSKDGHIYFNPEASRWGVNSLKIESYSLLLQHPMPSTL